MRRGYSYIVSDGRRKEVFMVITIIWLAWEEAGEHV